MLALPVRQGENERDPSKWEYCHEVCQFLVYVVRQHPRKLLCGTVMGVVLILMQSNYAHENTARRCEAALSQRGWPCCHVASADESNTDGPHTTDDEVVVDFCCRCSMRPPPTFGNMLMHIMLSFTFAMFFGLLCFWCYILFIVWMEEPETDVHDGILRRVVPRSLLMNPRHLRYSQNSISSTFSNGASVYSRSLSELPFAKHAVAACFHDGRLFALNNRTLFNESRMALLKYVCTSSISPQIGLSVSQPANHGQRSMSATAVQALTASLKQALTALLKKLWTSGTTTSKWKQSLSSLPSQHRRPLPLVMLSWRQAT